MSVCKKNVKRHLIDGMVNETTVQFTGGLHDITGQNGSLSKLDNLLSKDIIFTHFVEDVFENLHKRHNIT